MLRHFTFLWSPTNFYCPWKVEKLVIKVFTIELITLYYKCVVPVECNWAVIWKIIRQLLMVIVPFTGNNTDEWLIFLYVIFCIFNLFKIRITCWCLITPGTDDVVVKLINEKILTNVICRWLLAERMSCEFTSPRKQLQFYDISTALAVIQCISNCLCS